MVRTTLLVVGIAFLAQGCGAPTPASSSTCLTSGTVVQIADNHPNGDHKLTVPAADVVAGVAKTYDIRGDNTGHGHTVTITAAQFASLAAGTPVTITSSDLGAVGNDHTHAVTIRCAP